MEKPFSQFNLWNFAQLQNLWLRKSQASRDNKLFCRNFNSGIMRLGSHGSIYISKAYALKKTGIIHVLSFEVLLNATQVGPIIRQVALREITNQYICLTRKVGSILLHKTCIFFLQVHCRISISTIFKYFPFLLKD